MPIRSKTYIPFLHPIRSRDWSHSLLLVDLGRFGPSADAVPGDCPRSQRFRSFWLDLAWYFLCFVLDLAWFYTIVLYPNMFKLTQESQWIARSWADRTATNGPLAK